MQSAQLMLEPVSEWVRWLSHDHTPNEGGSSRYELRPIRPVAEPATAAPRRRRVALTDDEATQLAERVRHGDEAAFRVIYLAFYRPLWEFAYSILGAGDAAEDVVQEVFATWWARRESTEVERRLDPYLYGAVRHLAANWRRGDGVRNREDIAAAVVSERSGMSEPIPSADTIVETHDLEQALVHAITSLPHLRRTALMLRVRHGLEYATIAEVMSISPEAAMIHVSRARTTLRTVLKRFLPS